ncbi:MAG: hypothetical protein HPY69_17090 [Armatimonadetes bacterium]|nr:hypothetical protein [Armatimonadota bacterium]
MRCPATLLALTLVGTAASAEGPRLIFQADLDGSTAAQLGQEEAVTQGTPSFARGRDGRQAYIADGTCVLSYPALGNLNKARGTVALWVCPRWNGDDGQNHSFFSDDLDFNQPERNNLHLWKWLLGDQLRFDIRTAEPRDIASPVTFWRAGEWHHIAAAWNCRQGTWLFVDGQLVAAMELRWEPIEGTRFFVGCNWAGQQPADALISDVRIYDGPLDAGQVLRVSEGKALPAVRAIRLVAPREITVGETFEVSLDCVAETPTPDALPLTVALDGLPLPALVDRGIRLRAGEQSLGPLSFTLPAYYHVVAGRHELTATLAGAVVADVRRWRAVVDVVKPPASPQPARWRWSARKVLRDTRVYLAPGPGVAFWFDGEVRPYDAAGQALCRSLVASGRITDVLPCRLLDEVDCTGTDHSFREWGQSRVVTLGDGRRYRITGPRDSVQEQRTVYGNEARLLPAFQYRLATAPRPVPHLLVAETINDRERYLETAVDMAPGSRVSPLLAGAGTGGRDLINLHVTYTGREYPCDAQSLQQVTLFYPKSDAVTATISASGRELDPGGDAGAAVRRLAVYEVTADLGDLPALSEPGERSVSLFYPWGNPLYNEYGFSDGTESTRRASADALCDYLRFMGFGRLEFHPYQFGRSAEFRSRLYPRRAAGDLFADVLPVARDRGIEVVPRIDSTCFYLSDDSAKELYADAEAFQVTRKGETMRFFGLVPDPLHPQVQELLRAMVCELAEQTKGWPNVPAVGFRANGKFGNLYVGVDRAHPPEESGYSEFDIREFERDSGVTVGGSAGDADSRYQWLRANAWDRWIAWRCQRIHDHWAQLAQAVRAVDPGKKLIVFTKIPSNDPGEKRDWVNAPVDLLALHRYHGYDPELFRDDEGLVLSRVIGISADRYWPEPWNKRFFFEPSLDSFFRSREPSGVELYYVYWELPDHPLGFRVGPASPRGRAYYEPMTHALRHGNPGHLTFYNWFRATTGHELDLREFCRAYRGLPMVSPRPFTGRVLPEETTADDTLCVRMYRDRIGIINDSAEAREVTLELPAGYAPAGLRDVTLNEICTETRAGGQRQVRLALRPWDLRTLAPR